MIGQTNLVFSAVCVTSDDIESTQSIGELLSVDVDTFVKTHIVVVHTAVVEDVDHVRFDIFTRDSQGSAFVLHDEDGISTCLIGSGPFFFTNVWIVTVDTHIADVDTAGVPALGTNAAVGGGSVLLVAKVLVQAVQVSHITVLYDC